MILKNRNGKRQFCNHFLEPTLSHTRVNSKNLKRGETMCLRDDEVQQILKLIDQSNFTELDLKSGDLHLKISKHGCGLGGSAPPSLAEQTGAQPLPPTPSPEAGSLENRPAGGREDPAPTPEPLADQGLLPIYAPTLGIFYRSPKPGSPPFVEEGDLIEENDTVCIIEVMKLFNHIKAGIKGRVARICAENGAMVEHKQPIFLIKPE